jgi:transposase InsO family protein
MTAHGRQLLVVSDNGTELASRAILGWCQQHDVDWHDIAPGNPQQNGLVESVIGRLRDDCNLGRPHGGFTPAEATRIALAATEPEHHEPRLEPPAAEQRGPNQHADGQASMFGVAQDVRRGNPQARSASPAVPRMIATRSTA